MLRYRGRYWGMGNTISLCSAAVLQIRLYVALQKGIPLCFPKLVGLGLQQLGLR